MVKELAASPSMVYWLAAALELPFLPTDATSVPAAEFSFTDMAVVQVILYFQVKSALSLLGSVAVVVMVTQVSAGWLARIRTGVSCVMATSPGWVLVDLMVSVSPSGSLK